MSRRDIWSGMHAEFGRRRPAPARASCAAHRLRGTRRDDAGQASELALAGPEAERGDVDRRRPGHARPAWRRRRRRQRTPCSVASARYATERSPARRERDAARTRRELRPTVRLELAAEAAGGGTVRRPCSYPAPRRVRVRARARTRTQSTTTYSVLRREARRVASPGEREIGLVERRAVEVAAVLRRGRPGHEGELKSAARRSIARARA